MKLLEMDIPALCQLTFMSEKEMIDILIDKTSYEEIEEFYIQLLSTALHCDPLYFIDETTRKKDLLIATQNRGIDTPKSMKVKSKIQSFLDDYAFVNEILYEEQKVPICIHSSDNVRNAVQIARKMFAVDTFPGNLFPRLEKAMCTDKYNFVLFKENLDNLSGFIGYGKSDLAAICINYNRSLGHQNFTLAHEIGHWLLHKGVNLADADSMLYSVNELEKEANDFANKLLYPEEMQESDYHSATDLNLFVQGKEIELSKFVNSLCHKYCLSFEFILRSLLYKNMQASEYQEVRDRIEVATGKKIGEMFDKESNKTFLQYQQLKTPYVLLDKKVDYLVIHRKIGVTTGDAIKFRFV